MGNIITKPMFVAEGWGFDPWVEEFNSRPYFRQKNYWVNGGTTPDPEISGATKINSNNFQLTSVCNQYQCQIAVFGVGHITAPEVHCVRGSSDSHVSKHLDLEVEGKLEIIELPASPAGGSFEIGILDGAGFSSDPWCDGLMDGVRVMTESTLTSTWYCEVLNRGEDDDENFRQVFDPAILSNAGKTWKIQLAAKDQAPSANFRIFCDGVDITPTGYATTALSLQQMCGVLVYARFDSGMFNTTPFTYKLSGFTFRQGRFF